MERVNRILEHSVFKENLERLQILEKDRIFCNHTMEHFLDTARLAYIRALEEQLDLPRELIYAAALLHDIGRTRQYTENIPHHEAGAELAGSILPDCGFDEAETAQICEAIRNHRNQGAETLLGKILYEADKKSRNCFCCPAAKECNWPREKRNQYIQR